MEVDEKPVDAELAAQNKTLSTAQVAAPKRKRVIDEDDEDDGPSTGNGSSSSLAKVISVPASTIVPAKPSSSSGGSPMKVDPSESKESSKSHQKDYETNGIVKKEEAKGNSTLNSASTAPSHASGTISSSMTESKPSIKKAGSSSSSSNPSNSLKKEKDSLDESSEIMEAPSAKKIKPATGDPISALASSKPSVVPVVKKTSASTPAKVKKEESDSEDENNSKRKASKHSSVTPKKAKSSTPKKTSKPSRDDESESSSYSSEDSDAEVESKKKKPTPKKQTARQKANNNDNDSDGDYGSDGEKPGAGDEADSDEEFGKNQSKKSEKKSTAKKSTPAKDQSSNKGAKSKEKKASSTSKKVKYESDSEAEKKPKAKSSDSNGKKDEKEKDDDKFKWWEEDPGKAMKKHSTWKWATLQHFGVLFPPAYVPHGVKMLYDGKPVDLNPEQEEVATWFAKAINGPHGGKPVFRKNFFHDFLKILNPKGSKQKHVIQNLELCDFSPITQHLTLQSEAKKARSKEEKDKEKEEKAAIKAKYGFATVNGHIEPLANFMIEPPGLFLGRGDHPKAGLIKRRVFPEDVTLNLGKDAEVPPCPMEGHKWGSIVHNHEVGWIATWHESILEHNKYVLFGAASSIRGSSDRKKFEKARLLKDHIVTIRADYTSNLKSKEMLDAQRATAMWIIDHLALRVGNEKKEDEADTVGCCSLRVEHVKLTPPCTIEFDFLGKDSMPYQKKVDVPVEIYNNFHRFTNGKRPSEDIFDRLTTTSLNAHLSKLMPGLSAKVFRTYNASITLQEQLAKFAEEYGGEPGEVDVKEDKLKLFYNRANRQVAILCNHQKTISKTLQSQLDTLDAQIEDLREQAAELKTAMKALKKGEAPPNPKKRKREEDEEDKAGKKKKKEESMPTTVEQCKKKLDKVEARISQLESTKADKGEGAQIQNSTSKINYMDPRITIAFCNKVGLQLKKVFPATLLEKFAWAIAEVEEDPDFKF